MTCVAILKRIIVKSSGVAGEIAINRDDQDTFRCGMIERGWNNNEPFVSCIPVGTYKVVKRDGSNQDLKYPDAWEVTGVPGRSGIVFHIANWPPELSGCLAPNSWIEYHPGNPLVKGSSSGAAFDRMNTYLDGLTEFTLQILE